MWHLKEKCFVAASHKSPVHMEEKIRTRREGVGVGWGRRRRRRNSLCAKPHVSELLKLKAPVSDVASIYMGLISEGGAIDINSSTVREVQLHHREK